MPPLKISSNLLENVDEPIINLVKQFNDLGFKTIKSCCGWTWREGIVVPQDTPLYIQFQIDTRHIYSILDKICVLANYPWHLKENTLLWKHFGIIYPLGNFIILEKEKRGDLGSFYLVNWVYQEKTFPCEFEEPYIHTKQKEIYEMEGLMKNLIPRLTFSPKKKKI